MTNITKLDYSITDINERKKLVEQILSEIEEPSSAFLEILANYLITCIEKEERKQKKILTENRLSTIKKRELSMEGLSSKFEEGEDALYGLITNDKNIIFKPKNVITKEDIATIPYLRQLREGISLWEEGLKRAEGKDRYIIKKALIEMRKEQYIIKESFVKPIRTTQPPPANHPAKLSGTVTITPSFSSSGITLTDETAVAEILANYQNLKSSTIDSWCLISDLDNLIEKTIKPQPQLYCILRNRLAGYQNPEIQEIVRKEFGVTHPLSYFSTVFRKRIPHLIAEESKKQLINWHYLEKEKGHYKKCGRCGRTLLATEENFSRNSTSVDGWYSICKECRRKK